MDDKEIDILLEKWFEAKQELSTLEKKIDKYKKYADRLMNDNKVDFISNHYYTLTKKDMSRNSLLKDDVPPEIWNKFCRKINYPMFVLKKNK